MIKLFHRFNDIENPTRFVVFGFLLIILLGSTMLSLPISSHSGHSTSFLDALFTATSATCVTGLVVFTTSTHWSIFGKIVIMLLIQTGGLGIMSIASIGFFITGQRVSLRGRLAMRDSLSVQGTAGVVKLMKYILLFTFGTEAISAFLLSFVFVPDFGWVKGISYSIFHAISAFCNAGFDILGSTSMEPYQTNFIVNIAIMGTIVVGGFGFFEILDLLRSIKRRRSPQLHTKFILTVTAVLIFGGAVLYFIFERSGVLNGYPLHEKVLISFFQSITTRTAGFASFDQSRLRASSLILTLLLMFIGGSPASTAGGIKNSTMGVLVVSVYSYLRGHNDINIMHKRISDDLLKRAITIFMMTLLIILVSFMILSFSEDHLAGRDIIFEIMSAMGTVGLSTGITSSLTSIGKMIIIVIMFIGRVGTLSFITLIAVRKHKDDLVRYTVGRINIG